MSHPLQIPPARGRRVDGTDAVVYQVDAVGSFTLCLEGKEYPAPAGEWMRVHFGATDSPHDFHPEVAAHPVVNRVRLGGWAVISASALMEYLENNRAAPMRHWGAWNVLTVRRAGEQGSFRLADEVPEATRDRTALLVAHLVEDYLGRGDYFDMVRAFDDANAPARLRAHQQRIADLREHLRVTELDLAHELDLADRQLDRVDEQRRSA